MPGYLQRIAISGARVTPTAKPLMPAPPIMPGFGPPVLAGEEERRVADAEPSPPVQVPRPAATANESPVNRRV